MGGGQDMGDKKVAGKLIDHASDKIRELLDAKREKAQKDLKQNQMNGENMRPLTSFYPVVEDNASIIYGYMKKSKINQIQFQKVKSENQILTETANSMKTKLYDTIREDQNYCYRNVQLFDKLPSLF